MTSRRRTLAYAGICTAGRPPRRLSIVVEPNYSINPLDGSTWAAFAALGERNNGIFGGCWCLAFHPEGGDKKAQGELNRERKLDRVRSGTAHAALVSDGDDPAALFQYGRTAGQRLIAAGR